MAEILKKNIGGRGGGKRWWDEIRTTHCLYALSVMIWDFFKKKNVNEDQQGRSPSNQRQKRYKA